MANLKQHIQLQQQQQHQQQLQPPSPPPPPPPPPQQQKPGSSPLQPSWIPSSVRRNCDYCVKKKVKCVGNSNGAGCNICVRKSIRCEYSVKKKPGPKCRKREDEEGDDEAIRSPIPSSSIIHNGGQAHILTSPSRGAAAAAAAAVAAAAAAAARPQSAYALHRGGRSASFEAEHGGEYGGGAAVGGGGSRSLVSSPSSEHLLTPSKKARPTHDKGTRAARRHVEEEKRQPFVQQQPQLLQPVAPIVSPWRWNQSDDSLRTTLFNGRGMTPNHDLRRRASMSALPQPITPGTGAVGGGGAADEGVGSNSLHAGGGPPVTPPSAFRGLSPPNSAASASGVNVRYGAVLDGGVLEGLGGSGGGGYDARVGSGGGQPFGQSPPPDGAGGGRAGSLNGLGIANGGSFVGGFEVGERVHLEKLFQQVLDPVDVAVPDGSDVSDVSTNISENSDDENGPRGSTNADGTPVRRTGGSRHRHRVRGAEPAGGGAAERDGAGGTGTSSGDGTGGSAGDSGAGGALNRPNFCDSINGAAAFNGPGAGNGRSDGAWGGGVGSEQQQQQLLQQQNHGQGQSQQQQLEQQQRRQFWQRHVQQQQQQQLQEMQQQMQQQQRSATDAPCSPHHQAHGHHRHRKRAPKAGSASSAPQIPTAAQQQQQQQQQQMLLHPPTLPRLGSSDSSWRGLLDTPAIIHGNSSSGGDDSSPVAPLRHPSFSGFADGGSGGSGGSGGPGAPGAEATIGRGPTPPMHVYDSSPLAGASGENSLGGANGQQWGRVAMQNGAGGSVGGDDRSGSLSWGERGGSFSEAGVAAGGGVGGSSGVASGGGGAGGNGAAGSEVGGNGNSGIGGCPPFVSDVGVGMGVIGPAALHTGTGSHARSYSYGFGEWLPPADVTLDEDLDFLAGMSDEILPSGTEILAGRDHHF